MENKEHKAIYAEWKKGRQYTVKALAKKYGKSERMVHHIIQFCKKKYEI